jgi:hypothetical protein
LYDNVAQKKMGALITICNSVLWLQDHCPSEMEIFMPNTTPIFMEARKSRGCAI